MIWAGATTDCPFDIPAQPKRQALKIIPFMARFMNTLPDPVNGTSSQDSCCCA